MTCQLTGRAARQSEASRFAQTLTRPGRRRRSRWLCAIPCGDVDCESSKWCQDASGSCTRRSPGHCPNDCCVTTHWPACATNLAIVAATHRVPTMLARRQVSEPQTLPGEREEPPQFGARVRPAARPARRPYRVNSAHAPRQFDRGLSGVRTLRSCSSLAVGLASTTRIRNTHHVDDAVVVLHVDLPPCNEKRRRLRSPAEAN